MPEAPNPLTSTLQEQIDFYVEQGNPAEANRLRKLQAEGKETMVKPPVAPKPVVHTPVVARSSTPSVAPASVPNPHFEE